MMHSTILGLIRWRHGSRCNTERMLFYHLLNITPRSGSSSPVASKRADEDGGVAKADQHGDLREWQIGGAKQGFGACLTFAT